MTREEIISGLKFTIEMFLMDPITGETLTEPRNNMDKTSIDACKGAIELLEQETVSKESYDHEYFLRKEFEIKIAKLEQESRWIPVSERLPKHTGTYLVTVFDKGNEEYLTGMAHYVEPNNVISEQGWQDVLPKETIVAWMPLPEPFEPQESEVDNG